MSTISASTSTNINQDKLVEITSSLKTRLSYAFIKLQNGWTGQSLDQIENGLQFYQEQQHYLQNKALQSPLLHSKVGKTQQGLQSPPSLHRRMGSKSEQLKKPDGQKRRKKKLTVQVTQGYDSPSEKSSEEDAVESLMFLSSPRARQTKTFTY